MHPALTFRCAGLSSGASALGHAIAYGSMANMVKVTYTLDDETVARIRRIAARLGAPQSRVVRDAVKDYETRADRLSDEERTRMLAVLERIRREPPTRAQSAVDRELRQIRRARRGWARPTSA